MTLKSKKKKKRKKKKKNRIKEQNVYFHDGERMIELRIYLLFFHFENLKKKKKKTGCEGNWTPDQ